MLKVNTDKILEDYNTLNDLYNQNLKGIESEARGFANMRGYDEEKTEQFVKYVLQMEGNGGLCAEDKAVLDTLSKYLIEVADDERALNVEELMGVDGVDNEVINQY